MDGMLICGCRVDVGAEMNGGGGGWWVGIGLGIWDLVRRIGEYVASRVPKAEGVGVEIEDNRGSSE